MYCRSAGKGIIYSYCDITDITAQNAVSCCTLLLRLRNKFRLSNVLMHKNGAVMMMASLKYGKKNVSKVSSDVSYMHHVKILSNVLRINLSQK